MCEACRIFGKSESECIRESSKNVGGQEKAGLPDDRKRKVVQGCQMIEKAVSCRGCVVGWAGSVAVCDIRPRHPIFLL